MPDHYARAREHFERATADHEMIALRDEGLYRHLRFAEPGTYIYGYDLITWPGHLAIEGDLDSGYVFARIDDMFQFFASGPDINPDYWPDTWEWDLREWNHQFLICCFAIRAGVEGYRRAAT